MNRSRSRLLSLTVTTLLLVTVPTSASAAAEDQVSNPQFAAWSAYAVGSTATLVAKMDGGMTMESVRTLKEKAEDHVVIDIRTTLAVNGKKQPSRPRTETVTATVPKRECTDAGHEKVEAGGKTYDCAVYEMADVAPNYIGSNPKLWISPEVPGGIVKVRMSTPVGAVDQLLKIATIKK